MQDSLTNVPEFSVSELAFSLKKTLESTYGHVRVRGELSRVKVHTSGHMYSAIKDDSSAIDAVCWRGTLSKLSIKPEEGLEVICTGRISTYPARSNYQLIIESMELAGEGALLKMLEQRKQKLASEGLFDQTRKKRVPFLPDRIGVITSPTGAVIRDIMHRLNDRFPRHVLLWPVRVQGETAAAEIEAALKGFNALDGAYRPDLLILARGGGSLEDLMPFNEENVVRAVAASDIPVITAVGHETDTTLVDYASDLRAPTPTGAAEMAVPRRTDWLATMKAHEESLIRILGRLLENKTARVDTLEAKLGDPARMLESKSQTLDFLSEKHERLIRHYAELKEGKLNAVLSGLRAPVSILREAERFLDVRYEAFRANAKRLLDEKQKQLEFKCSMLESLSYESVLKRGYAVVRDAQGKLVNARDNPKPGDLLELEFEGQKKIRARAEGQTEKRKPPSPASQRSLF